MIRLLTGLPGSGKSLRTMWYIEAYLKEGRPVYVAGIDGICMPAVMPLEDPNGWEDLPHGSVIVVDEVQKLWPSRRGAEPIPPVRALSEHRHHGKDFVIVTQHPTMIDSYVRRLVGHHEHLVRKFGLAASHVFAWNEVQDDVQGTSARELSEDSLWAYPKHLYAYYKSATLHTVKRRVPKALYMVAFAGLVIPLLAWASYSTISGWTDNEQDAPPEAESVGLPTLSASGAAPARSADTPLDYATRFLPRVRNVPWSAPAYDEFKVQDYPRAHCIIVGDQRVEAITCNCYTQQGTPMDIEDRVCVGIARNGYWDPFKAPMQSKQDNEASTYQAVPVPEPVPVASGITGWDRSLQRSGIPDDAIRADSLSR